MSPITVFTVVNCPYCKQVKSALEDCQLPYTEISLSKYPQKRKDLLRLTGDKVSVPQVFVHERWIGGVDDTLGFLRDVSNSCWGTGNNRSLQESPMEKLVRELGPRTSSNGSQNPRFMVPILEEEEDPDHSCGEEGEDCDEHDENDDDDIMSSGGARPLSERLERRSSTRLPCSPTDNVRIPCPDGTIMTVSRLTEKLKAILQYGKRRYNFTTYKNCCTAEEVVDTLSESYNISRIEAEDFGKVLNKHQILHHVCEDHTFRDSNAFFFRLQCYHTPAILNSYRIWPSTSAPANPIEVMQRLTRLFGRIEEAVTDGNVNYRIAYMCSDFPAFEDAVCELQRVDLSDLEGADMVAFSLNVYNMMRKYAFMKLGVPVSESSRTTLLNKVCFNVAGYVVSLQEWVDGVLRGNRKSPVTKGHAFCRKDPRLALSLLVGGDHSQDCRIHFAIHNWSSSRRSPPVKTFTGAALEDELGFVAQAFCEEDDNVAFSIIEKKMRLAPVFRRYKCDFLLHTRTIPRVVLRFLYGARRARLDRFLNSSGRKDRTLKMSSRAEDWTLGISDFVVFDASRLNPNVRKIGKCVRSTTSPSSYRPETSSRGGSSLRSSAVSGDNDDESQSSVHSHSGGLGRFLPVRRASGGKIKRNKTDSIPKPFLRRYVDPLDRLDEMDSNVSATSVCSSNVSEILHVFDDNVHHLRSSCRAA